MPHATLFHATLLRVGCGKFSLWDTPTAYEHFNDAQLIHNVIVTHAIKSDYLLALLVNSNFEEDVLIAVRRI